MTKTRARWLTALLACSLTVAACSSGNQRVVIFAASSLAPTTTRIDALLNDDPSTDNPDWVLAGSSRLIAQVRDGARPDIIVAADAVKLEPLVGLGYLIVDELQIKNHLVLVVAPGNPAKVTKIQDLSSQAPLVGLCAAEVPCGAAAQLVSEELGITFRPDTAEPNVRALAHKLASGELDAGLVYATDAHSLGLHKIDDPFLPAQVDCPARGVVEYGIAVLAASPALDGTKPSSLVERYLKIDVLRDTGFTIGLC